MEDGREEEDAGDSLYSEDQRRRLGGISHSIRQRAVDQVAFFAAMVKGLALPTPNDFIDWFEVVRVEGRDMDVGFFRKFVDPAAPFMTLLGHQAQGALITSATLTDQTGVEEVDWSEASPNRHAAPFISAHPPQAQQSLRLWGTSAGLCGAGHRAGPARAERRGHGQADAGGKRGRAGPLYLHRAP